MSRSTLSLDKNYLFDKRVLHFCTSAEGYRNTAYANMKLFWVLLCFLGISFAAPADNSVSLLDTVSAFAFKDSPECTLCKFVLTIVDDFLQQNRTEQSVEKVLEGFCSRFPDTIKDECASFVETYYPTIVQLLVQRIQPDDICKQLGVCEKTKETQVFKKASVGSLECNLCEAVISEGDKLLQENRTMNDIQKALDDVCNMLPGDISATCRGIIDPNLPQIINFLANNVLQPHAVCKALGLCTDTKVRRGFNYCKNATDCTRQFSCPYGAECVMGAGKALGTCACLLPAGRRNVGSHARNAPYACSSNPCKHGICKASPRFGYFCECSSPRYIGRNCDIDLASMGLARTTRTQCINNYNCRHVTCPTGYHPYCPMDHGLAASTCGCKH